MAHLPEALADAMSESYSNICSILETDATMKDAKRVHPTQNCRKVELMKIHEHT
jgi:hypothetical protein